MRKALIGVMMAATAITPIVSASAQEWRGRGNQQQVQDQGGQPAERQAPRAERQAQRAEGQVQRVEGRMQRFQDQVAPTQVAPTQIDRGQRFQRSAPAQVPPQVQQEAPRASQFSREQWQGDRNRGDGASRFQRQVPVQVQPTQDVQNRQFNRDRPQSDRNRTAQRGDWNGTRSWDGNRTDGASRVLRQVPVQVQPTQDVQNRQFSRDRLQSDRNRTAQRGDWNSTHSWDGNTTRDGNRTSTWDGNRTSDRSRSGTWNGRNYSWNRDGRTYNWNSDWRRNIRYDWQSYRRYNSSIFNLGSYYAPYRNYSYRRFSTGFFLEPLFFSSNYWIGDPWQYRLPTAYPGTRWVRYYNDVLLVDIYSGEVIDVIYDFFY